MKTPERRYRRLSGVLVVDFEHIPNFLLVFILLPLNK